MTLTATAALSFAAPSKVLVSVSSSPSTTAVLRIFRVHQDGTRHRVLTDGRAVINGTWVGYDYHPPFNQAVTYIASTGLEPDSAPSSAVFIPSDVAWLQHQTDPDLSYMIDKILAPQQAVSRSTRATEFQILGSSKTVVRTSFPMESEEGSFTLRVPVDDIPRVEALLAEDIPMLLNGPWGTYDYGWQWIWVKSAKRSNAAGFVQFPTRNYEIAYQVVADPDADTEPPWTYADAMAAFPGATYADMASVWASYQNSYLDVRV